MPSRRSYGRKPRYKRSSKRRYKKKQRFSRRSRPRFGKNLPMVSRINPRTFGVSQYLYVKLKYCFQEEISNIGGGLTTHQFRGNSCFDPDFTGIGQQPRYFDEYSAMYRNYRVMATGVKTRYINRTGTVARMWTYARADSSVLTTKEDLCELNEGSVFSTDSRRVVAMKRYFTTKGVFGPHMSETFNTRATTGNNPVTVWYLNVSILNVDPVGGLDGQLNVDLVFYVRFENPKYVG